MTTLLLIEDDPDLGPLLKRNLEYSGYRVILAGDGMNGLTYIQSGVAHLILLDLMIPCVDGLTVLNRTRRDGISTPVIILTARGMESERLEGFRVGCDDYITKPFCYDELIARIKAVLRRCGVKEERKLIVSGGVRIDPSAHTAQTDEGEIKLTPKEFGLLVLFAERPNQALSRYFLLDEVWGEDSESATRTVDVHVSSLRKKLEALPSVTARIESAYKVGYLWYLPRNR